MRRDKVFRFVTIAFAVGAFVGLVSGLAFGGGPGKSTPKAAAQTTATSSSSTPTSEDASTASQPMTAERAKAIGANEMGEIPVLMYHHLGPEESDYTRTPENFREDISLLKADGYYPINVRDLASGNIDIPAGKSPVVITFDDSSPNQYRILDDNSLDPNSAVGILQAAVEAGDWAPRASFFVLIDVVPKEREIWGQEDLQQEKLRNLVQWGYEIGSHTVTHLDLKKASTDKAVKELAQSQSILENMIGGGYQVTSIAIPYGEYPESDTILTSGQYEDIKYGYTAALSIALKPSVSPFSKDFKALHIPRITCTANYLSDALKTLKNNPSLRYISDGDPTTVSAPADLDPKLGDIRTDLGRPVIRY